ncbi:hypothetical protein JJB09_03655 [Rhizobium sp. KVB221]|uniref:Uncharacterized protein n=1 Tax=Rhizobium setariae TaxID=2801340 RepID=A0A936YRP7_9HYPH|nr:hypothetical protein [Rhizobium setariae]MBL0371115.1 hypothetical protein [Rhizobium setariae]
MTILMRRFTIVCLTFAVFALGLTMVVNSQARRVQLSQTGHFGLNAPCPQPLGLHCSIRN